MSVDVLRNPPTVTTTLTWYRPGDTTPFAVAGHEGTVLAVLTEEEYGPGVQEVWFLNGKWEDSEGAEIDSAYVLAFAIPTAPVLDDFADRPFQNDDDPERLADELHALLADDDLDADALEEAAEGLLPRIHDFLRSLKPAGEVQG